MERIFVTVRAKPLPPDDAKASPWRISANSITLTTHSSKFDFDRVFGENCRTKEVYDVRTKEIVASAVRGFNGTVFAYGQTSSGKTYTMRGSAGEPGIIPLAIDDLFQSIREELDREFLVRVSYMEIYNEEINDLLAPEHKKLQIHESIERGIFVAGLKEEIVTCPAQVLELMEFGEARRHIGETNMNLHSSRSHTIFRVIIESRERKPADGDGDSFDAIRVSVLNLVDLAGSERVIKTGAEGVRLKEGSHINKSLLTLGTVIKKLSEGVESQGGHVPYRDSKLTRILQPALGGNANTAIICNVTLAQIHSDETKSSLQFASRALRVTNCAHVNEILTDAALLKRQKKEIEELRARLQGSHSEHWEDEILNLRNTLLQSELEKERIALELEEEKKDKAQREKRLQEKIANLSSMFLLSNANAEALPIQTKRRNTWCPVSLLDKPVNVACATDFKEVYEALEAEASKGSEILCPAFEENTKEDPHHLKSLPSQNDKKNLSSVDEFPFLDKHALMHVTNRRKLHRRNTCSPVRVEMDVVLDSEMRFEDLSITEKYSASDNFKMSTSCGGGSSTIVAKWIPGFPQLNNQIKLLTSGRKSDFDKVSEVKQTSCTEKLDEVWESLGLESELSQTQETICSISCLVEDAIQDLFISSKIFLEMKASTLQELHQLKSTVKGYGEIYKFLLKKAGEMETEKCLSLIKSVDDSRKIEELELELENCKDTLNVKISEHELEKDGLHHQILDLQNEVTFLSASSLAKENEKLRKDVEKTRTKLKETDSKFKNVVQEKIRLEGEKAHNEREIKHLLSQRALLERDISRCESLIEKRNETRSSDLNRVKSHVGPSEHALQLECQRLEVNVSELEAEIAFLNEKYVAIVEERYGLLITQSSLDAELNATMGKLNETRCALEQLQEEVEAANLRCQQFETRHEELEGLVKMVSQEKEEMGMQLTDALLELEGEKSARLCVERNLAETKEKLEEKIAILTEDFAQVTLNDRKRDLKLRMRLHSSQGKLDMYRGRYQEVLSDMSLMHRKYAEASAMFKDQLALYGTEILRLKKELQLGAER